MLLVVLSYRSLHLRLILEGIVLAERADRMLSIGRPKEMRTTLRLSYLSPTFNPVWGDQDRRDSVLTLREQPHRLHPICGKSELVLLIVK